MCTSHAGLETIGTGAGKHLVDTENVEGVDANAHVEGILAGVLGHVLVDGNTGSLKSLRTELLLLTGQKVHAEGELLNGSLLTANIVDSDLGIGDTTAEPRLDVRLALAITVAPSRTSAHLLSEKTPGQRMQKRAKQELACVWWGSLMLTSATWSLLSDHSS